MSDGSIEFVAIPGINKVQVALSISPPGTFLGNGDFLIFVGGTGWGRTKTLGEAETLLLTRAKEYCQREIIAAQQRLVHWRRQLKKLEQKGIKRV